MITLSFYLGENSVFLRTNHVSKLSFKKILCHILNYSVFILSWPEMFYLFEKKKV